MKKELTYRQLIAGIFLIAFFAQTFNSTLVFADYFTNTIKYAKNCENKARPKLHCNGKCQMMKKLQQEEKKDQENPERKSENKSVLILSTKSFYATAPTYSLLAAQVKILLPYINGKATDRSLDIFHPPQA